MSYLNIRIMNFLAFLLISALIAFSSAYDDGELVSVAIILRHGARTMNNPAYFNITNDTRLTKGNGALTPVGKRAHYLAGKQIYHIYNSLIDSKYPTQSVHFVSSGLNRTIESMQAFAFGMFEAAGLSLTQDQNKKVAPPIDVKGIDDIREELKLAALPNYQRTVPIHNRLDVKDYTYDPHSNCPGFKVLPQKDRDEADRLDDEFKDLYKRIKENEKLPDFIREAKWTTEECYKLADNIQVVERNGAEFNFTLEDKLKEDLYHCSLNNSMRSFMVGKLRPKMVSHYLMRNVFDLFASVKNNSNNNRKVGVYLMSDAHLMAIHKLFNWTLEKYVFYVSALRFELRVKDKSMNTYTVTTIYNTNEIRGPKDMELEEFLTMINENTFKNDEEFNDACFNIKESSYDKDLYIVISFIIFGVLIIAWGVSWFCALSNREKKSDENESSLEQNLESL